MKNVAKPRNFEHLVHVQMPKKVILLARFPTRRDDFGSILASAIDVNKTDLIRPAPTRDRTNLVILKLVSHSKDSTTRLNNGGQSHKGDWLLGKVLALRKALFLSGIARSRGSPLATFSSAGACLAAVLCPCRASPRIGLVGPCV